MRQRPVWSNGGVAIVSGSSSHPSFSPVNRSAANRSASGAGAPIPTARRSPPIRSTGRCVRTARVNGGPGIRSIGAGAGRAIRPLVERNRQQQRVRDQKRRLRNLANNNSAFDLKRSAAQVWLVGGGLEHLANNNSAPAQVWVLEALPPRRGPQIESCQQQRSGIDSLSAG